MNSLFFHTAKCYDINTVITVLLSSLYYCHHCTISTVLSALYYQHCTVSNVLSALYCHHCTTVSTVLSALTVFVYQGNISSNVHFSRKSWRRYSFVLVCYQSYFRIHYSVVCIKRIRTLLIILTNFILFSSKRKSTYVCVYPECITIRLSPNSEAFEEHLEITTSLYLVHQELT